MGAQHDTAVGRAARGQTQRWSVAVRVRKRKHLEADADSLGQELFKTAQVGPPSPLGVARG